MKCADCAEGGATKAWHDSPPLCNTCKVVRSILHSGTDEARRHYIPSASYKALWRALERMKSSVRPQKTLRKAIESRLRVLARVLAREKARKA